MTTNKHKPNNPPIPRKTHLPPSRKHPSKKTSIFLSKSQKNISTLSPYLKTTPISRKEKPVLIAIISAKNKSTKTEQ
jgi:hypothetical protein